MIAGCLTEQGETELRKSCSDRLRTLHLDVTNHGNVLKAFDEVKRILPDGKGKIRSSHVMLENRCSTTLIWMFIDREAGEIIRLVAYVCLFV